jgi:hypothetical protein
MKRSSARRARRWVVQELTRWPVDQFSDPSGKATLLAAGKRNEKTLPVVGQG